MVVVLVGPVRSICMWILTFEFVPYCFLGFCFSAVEALAWALILCCSAEWKAECYRTAVVFLKRPAGYVWKKFRFQFNEHLIFSSLWGSL